MEGKTNAIIITVIVLILLVVSIVFKIRWDKKKSLAIASDPGRYQNSNENKGLPSWAISIICMFIISGISIFFDSWLQQKIGVNSYAYYLYGILSGIASYFIIRQNPRSIWYVILITNALLIIGIFPGDTDPAMIGGLIIAIIISITGFMTGRRK